MKNNTIVTTLILLLCVFIVTSCKKEEEVMIERTPVSLHFNQSKTLSAKGMKGSNNGLVFDHEMSMFSVGEGISAPSLLPFEQDLFETAFTFLDEDSIVINGIIHSSVSYSSGLERLDWRRLRGDDVTLKYRFNDDEFQVDLHATDIYEGDWVTIGYGNKENFSIFVNYQFGQTPYSGEGQAAFVDPAFRISDDDETWCDDFFDYLPQWTINSSAFQTLSPDNITADHLLMEEIKRYDFSVQD